MSATSQEAQRMILAILGAFDPDEGVAVLRAATAAYRKSVGLRCSSEAERMARYREAKRSERRARGRVAA